MKTNNVEILNRQIKGRMFVVGDIHGCYDLLMSRLKEIGFDFENDLLVSVGDLVDRGPCSFECVGLLKQPWFIAIRGNHEQFCIEGFIDYHVAQQHAHPNNGGAWFYHLCSQAQAVIVNAFLQLPIALEITFKGKKYGIVHAHVEENDWEAFKTALNTKPESAHRSRVDLAMWNRERVYARIEEQHYQAISNVDEVYFGHTILPAPMQKHNCFYIDTGAVATGILTIVELKGAGA